MQPTRSFSEKSADERKPYSIEAIMAAVMQREVNEMFSRWVYRRVLDSDGIETSDWIGTSSPALRLHFHHEVQITFVFDGLRTFLVGGNTVRLLAGQYLVIPPGVPHQSVQSDGPSTKSRDLFLRPRGLLADTSNEALIGTLPNTPGFSDDSIIDDLLLDIARNRSSNLKVSIIRPESRELVEIVCKSGLSIRDIATSVQMTREGFIRRFTREIGMTPHAYRIGLRACRARSMLRTNLAPVEAAFEAGFADQSHLGRVFKQNFGTSPAVYQKVWAA